MAFTLGSDIFTSIDEGLKLTYATGLSNFANLIAPLIGAFVSLYFVLKALNFLLSGGTQRMPFEVIKQAFNLSLFTFFAFNIPYYMDVVVKPVNSIGDEIANAFSTGKATAPVVIDQMANQILDTIQLIWENTPDLSITNLDVQPFLRAFSTIAIISIFGTIFIAVSALYLMIAKVLVALVLMLGPLYISAAFFPLTREYFMKWLGALLNYILLSAMFGFAFTLLTNLLQKFILGTDFSSPVPMGDLTNLKLLFCFLLFTGVVVALHPLTSQLTGGIGISGMGGVSGVGGALSRSLTKLAGVAASTAVKGTGNTIAGSTNKRLG